MDDAKIMQEMQSNYDLLLKTALQYTKSTDDARDVVHDIFVKVINQGIPHLKNSESCMSYLRSMIRNHALDVLKKQNRYIPYSDEQIAVLAEDDFLDDSFETMLLIKKLLQHYPVAMQQVFIRYALHDEPIQALAQEIGMKPQSLKRQFTRMKKLLRLRYEESTSGAIKCSP